jgi:hypothetical protein
MCVNKTFLNIIDHTNHFQYQHYIQTRSRIKVLLIIKPTIGTFNFVSQVLMKKVRV